jgi:cell division protein FtsZ
VAEIAREMGILTVAVVTKPFQFEGHQRKVIADQAYERLIQHVDTIITIPNDRILQIIDRKTSMMDAFEIVDDVLRQGVQGISDIISVPGLINVDFADARAIMENRGSALMGIGRGHGENRAVDAAKAAIASPLLEVSIDGAKGILFTVTGGSNLGMYEVTEAAKVITESADPQAKIIFGAIIDEALKDEIKVTVIATGFDQRLTPRSSKTVIAGGAYNPVASEPHADKFSFRKPAPEVTAIEARRAFNAPVVDKEPQPAAHQPHVQPPSYAPVHNSPPPQQPLPRVSNQPVQGSAASIEDDTVEIPALFRKKMM